MGMMAFRVLGPHERGRFAPEAWGHLLALNGSGALSSAELEHIIERALVQIDGRIALDDLRSLMEGAGFVEPNEGDQNQTVH
jgi:Smg protein